jgi:ankyrin repeat protein
MNINQLSTTGETALHIAVRLRSQSSQDVKALIYAGADVNLVTDSQGSALHTAIRHSNTAAVEILLDAGASCDAVDEKGDTPLLLAAFYSSAEVVQLLIDAGSNLNAINSQGVSMLLAAAIRFEKRTDVFDKIVAAGASAWIQDNFGTSAIHYACRDGHIGLVEMLLDCSENLKRCANIESIKHGTPLYQAAKSGHLRILQLLLTAGADVNWTCVGNILGPAIMVAAAYGHFGIVECLASHGALLVHHKAAFSSVFGTAQAFNRTRLLEKLKSHEQFMMDLYGKDQIDGISANHSVANSTIPVTSTTLVNRTRARSPEEAMESADHKRMRMA